MKTLLILFFYLHHLLARGRQFPKAFPMLSGQNILSLSSMVLKLKKLRIQFHFQKVLLILLKKSTLPRTSNIQ